MGSSPSVVVREEPRSLADIIGFAEIKKEFEKNQRGSVEKDKYPVRDER